ncbi:unnamed protein product [Linum tenue]|uniref:Uncharacterized protein n=1 Tax=Linum tenue TaxID=586396 RepID=A0AAV0KRJ3_9ROSI|nr:unnamed protein product [Linum tenue]CAI0424368.1 unnamed protein product [Linum tenue]
MRQVHNAPNFALFGKIKVSTFHSMVVLKQSESPSVVMFDMNSIKGLLEFNKETNPPFIINPYSYFAYSMLNAVGFKKVEVVVEETDWSYKGA